MCELAFSMTGERFEPPATAIFWRVRRLKTGGRGTPDVVFGPDGAPLMIPIDTELAEFRRLVKGEPGRYRLDLVDDNHKPCEDAVPAYLQLTGEADGAPSAPAAPQYDIVRELVRANTDMVKTIADRFASVMESAATLLRAADGAGLPARQPVATAPPLELVEEDEEEDDDDHRNGGEFDLGAFLTQMMPMINMVMAQRGGAKPAGRTASRAAAPAAAAPRNAGPAATAEPPSRVAETPVAAELDDAPAPGPEALAHFAAIQAQLSPEEAAVAQAVAAELSPAQVRAWMAQLSALSVDEAVQLIRNTSTELEGGAS